MWEIEKAASTPLTTVATLERVEGEAAVLPQDLMQEPISVHEDGSAPATHASPHPRAPGQVLTHW